ncbi:NAD-dependent protein deacetylase OS=Streptomyces gougerotii OX=53448 GN=cobB1 PE=3 SV=1 [Streptomyces diastaticus subsp. diastaticus]
MLIVNRDPTRGDRHALTRVALPLGDALTDVAGRLGVPLDERAPTETEPPAGPGA